MAESGQSSNSTNSTNSTDYLTIEELVLEFTPSQTDILVAIIYFGIVLSTNRFYAVAFMGIYYKKTLQLRYIQMIIVPILPVTLMTIGTFIRMEKILRP
ncbi:unnamed protein product, partial [Mesorhabditis belari]|uniref:Uncharacterized protein n=1 Tax=Mesorhabditis belari TaxID=2138241 RepID=A0AAF3FMI5_9BILA